MVLCFFACPIKSYSSPLHWFLDPVWTYLSLNVFKALFQIHPRSKAWVVNWQKAVICSDGLFPWLIQNILWHIFSTGSCGRGGQRGRMAKQVPRGGWSPRLELLSLSVLSLLHYHLCCSVFPFICSQSLAPSCSHPGIRWMGREVIDGAAADMGKGRINITKTGDFDFSFKLPPPFLKWK